MLKHILTPKIIKRFCHTHSKTIIDENSKKSIRDLIVEQNKKLDDINYHLRALRETNGDIKLYTVIFGFMLFFKPN